MSSLPSSSTPEERKRLKWEPAALLVLLLGLAVWIILGPASRPALPLRPGALTQDIRLADTRGVLEAAKDQGAKDYTFRVLIARSPTTPAYASPPMNRGQVEGLFGPAIVDSVVSSERNWLFRVLNITSRGNLVWIAIGLLGQAAFSGRILVQWISSERKGKSIINESFWWFSLFGGITLFSYFVWRQDPIGILGQSFGIVAYARNIRLMRKHARRAARKGEMAV